MSDGYSDPIGPEQVEKLIRHVADRISRSVRVCSDRYAEFLKADHVYDLAYANAFLAYQGPAHSKRYYADIACEGERDARDVADVAYRYADRTAKALENELRALQSVGASIREQYRVAGRGES